MRGRGTIPRTSPDARPLTRAFSSFASTTAQQRTTTSPPARVPERVPRTRPAPPLSEPTRRRRSVPRPRGSSYTSPAPNPRAPARSRAPRGPPPPGPGGAFSAGGRPRRVDVPVADEGLERSAAPLRAPGAEPEPYGARRRPWGHSAPRRPFPLVVETTLGPGPRRAVASNFDARPMEPSHTYVPSMGWPRGAPRRRQGCSRAAPERQICRLGEIWLFSARARRDSRLAGHARCPGDAHKYAASAGTAHASGDAAHRALGQHKGVVEATLLA